MLVVAVSSAGRVASMEGGGVMADTVTMTVPRRILEAVTHARAVMYLMAHGWTRVQWVGQRWRTPPPPPSSSPDDRATLSPFLQHVALLHWATPCGFLVARSLGPLSGPLARI